MLSTLKIKNVALIKELSINFFMGLNILSGETGAGKSIVIDSLSFVLGGKADKTIIRNGEDKCEVSALFEVEKNSLAATTLSEMGLEADTTILCHRVLDIEGKSKCYINGNSVPLTMLKTLTSTLCDIHGQSEHHSLFNVSKHIELVDKFGEDELRLLQDDCRASYVTYREKKKELSTFGGNQEERERLIDILRYQIKEIEDVALINGELEQLQSKRSKLLNLEKLLTALKSALGRLGNEDGSLLELLSDAASELDYAAKYDDEIRPQVERLQSVKYEIEDICSEVSNVFYGYESDENSDIVLNRIENRIEKIKNIYKKYGGNYVGAMAFFEKASIDYNKYSKSTELIEKLNNEIQVITRQMQKKMHELSCKRSLVAKEFDDCLLRQFLDLGLKNAKFETVVSQKVDKPTENGFDSVEFFMTANMGQPLKPLAKVISGGEASRFMLALKTITSDIDNVPLLVFDEIDTGISGEIAQMVAIKFVKIAREHQLIAITHLPQIAAMGDNNYLIEKRNVNSITLTNVKHLILGEKEQEVARLAGGNNIGEHGVLHAKELIEWCDKRKKEI